MVGELRLVSCSPRLRTSKSNYSTGLREEGRTMGFGISIFGCQTCGELVESIKGLVVSLSNPCETLDAKVIFNKSISPGFLINVRGSDGHLKNRGRAFGARGSKDLGLRISDGW